VDHPKPAAFVAFLIALYVLLVIVLPLALSAIVSYRSLPHGPACPMCKGETLRLVSRWLRWASRLGSRTELQRRWCVACQWEGVMRVSAARARRLEVVRVDRPSQGTGEASPEARAPEGAEGAIDLRRLEVDGRLWRVLVQCWCRGGRWYGRLLFISPSGRMLADSMEPLSGVSRHDVLGQALALPDALIAGRLRAVISDTMLG